MKAVWVTLFGIAFSVVSISIFSSVTAASKIGNSDDTVAATDDDDMMEKKTPLKIEDYKNQKNVIHLSHFTDDLHRAFMAVKIANMIMSRGIETQIFVDVEAARIADLRQNLNLRWGEAETTLEVLIDEFVTDGGRVIVCPHCAKAANLTNDFIRPGMEIGTKEVIQKLLIEADKVIDY